MKRIVSILLTFVLAISIFSDACIGDQGSTVYAAGSGNGTSIEAVMKLQVNTKWSKSYRKFLLQKEYLKSGDKDLGYDDACTFFYLRDMDANGIPELLIDNGYNGLAQTYVFSYKGTKVVYCGRFTPGAVVDGYPGFVTVLWVRPWAMTTEDSKKYSDITEIYYSTIENYKVVKKTIQRKVVLRGSSESTIEYQDTGTLSALIDADRHEVEKKRFAEIFQTASVASTTLQAPMNITAYNVSNGIRVAWTKSASAKGYYVYRKSGKSGWKKIATVKKPYYIDKKAKNGTKYSYTVQAYSGKRKSLYDKTGTAACRLTKIKITSAKYKRRFQITVKWKRNLKATGYQIQYSTNRYFSNGKTKTVIGARNSSYTIPTWCELVDYYYVRIRAYLWKNGVYTCTDWSNTKAVKVKK